MVIVEITEMHNEKAVTRLALWTENTTTNEVDSGIVRETMEIFARRLFWAVFPFDSVTYISVVSLYSKAPIWSDLKMNRWPGRVQ